MDRHLLHTCSLIEMLKQGADMAAIVAEMAAGLVPATGSEGRAAEAHETRDPDARA